MADVTKKIVLDFAAKENSIKKIQSTLSKLSDVGFSSDELNNQIAALSEINEIQDNITMLSKINTDEAKKATEELKKQLDARLKIINTIEDEPQEEIVTKQLFSFEDRKQISNIFTRGFESIIESAWTDLKEIFKSAWSELSNILSYSLLTDSSIRNLKMQYGFSSSEAYGFEQAKAMLGIQSDEDLYYMNPTQQRLFSEAFTKYSNKYSELYDSGFFTDLQEYQVEMNEFMQDIQLEVVQFFMNNKDTIMIALKFIMELAKAIISVTGAIVNFFGGTGRSSSQIAATQSDILRSSTVSTSNVVNNLSIDNKFTINNGNAETQNVIENAIKNATAAFS